MSKGGRPPLGYGLVDRTGGSSEAKERLKLILQTVSGERTVRSAAEALGIEESAFHELRRRLLERSVEELERKRPGRKPKVAVVRSEDAERIERLERELREARSEIQILELREEMAILMPHVLRPRQKAPKKEGGEGGR